MVEIVDDVLTIDVKHKMAAYHSNHSMAHILVSSGRLRKKKHKKKLKKSSKLVSVNVYEKSTIMNIVKKHQRKRELSNFSTFYDSMKSNEPVKRVVLKYYPRITNLLRPIYNVYGLDIAHRNDSSLKINQRCST